MCVCVYVCVHVCLHVWYIFKDVFCKLLYKRHERYYVERGSDLFIYFLLIASYIIVTTRSSSFNSRGTRKKEEKNDNNDKNQIGVVCYIK